MRALRQGGHRGITAVDGVTGVTVDLPTGTVAVAGDRPLDDARVRAAVTESGYELADRAAAGPRRA